MTISYKKKWHNKIFFQSSYPSITKEYGDTSHIQVGFMRNLETKISWNLTDGIKIEHEPLGLYLLRVNFSWNIGIQVFYNQCLNIFTSLLVVGGRGHDKVCCQAQPKLQVKHSLKAELALFSVMYKSNFIEWKTCFYLNGKVLSPRDVIGLDLASW